MKKIKVIYLSEGDFEEQFVEDILGEGGFRTYWENMECGSLDALWFCYRDIDKRVFIVDDGGEYIRLKDGSIVNVCWRGGCCRVWEEVDEEVCEYIESFCEF